MKISGFRELAPSQRAFEKSAIEIIDAAFSLYGFQNIETSSAQSAKDLLAKGETSKEIYLLSRLQGVENKTAEINLESEKQLGLRFDQTIPLANYIYEFSNDIVFPFRAYQIGKVWRGERAQAGRFREFTQADIDIISSSQLSITDEAESIILIARVFNSLEELGCPKALIKINSRKIIESFCKYLGISKIDEVLQIIDKLKKIGADSVLKDLADKGYADKNAAQKLIEFTESNLKTLENDKEFLNFADENVKNEIEKLKGIISLAADSGFKNISVDFSIARGLDYYTGLVFETFLNGFEDLGSVCSGGRYDNLVKKGNAIYQGIGASIGITRLIYILLEKNLAKEKPYKAADALIILDSENDRDTALKIAESFRQRGISALVSPNAKNYGKQINFAQKQGILFVWFLTNEVKNIITGEQKKADPETWAPDLN
ncbi:MAG: histidine--tRNA ligase [Bifidobacteriaceae bacterium]|jgi:histidyl-tRNA synthetase|nr:histidine--tRNA ligase [Bifidobacteriaceae bacterium]